MRWRLDHCKQKRKCQQRPRHTSPRKERARQKQCADKNLGTKFRQRGNSLYLAFLIGRARSTPSYAFLRVLQTSSAPYLAASIANSVRYQHGHDLHSPGGVHALLRVQHLGCRMLFIRLVNRAVSNQSGPLVPEGRARDSGHSLFRGPARGRLPRGRISNVCSSSTCSARTQRQSVVIRATTAAPVNSGRRCG